MPWPPPHDILLFFAFLISKVSVGPNSLDMTSVILFAECLIHLLALIVPHLRSDYSKPNQPVDKLHKKRLQSWRVFYQAIVVVCFDLSAMTFWKLVFWERMEKIKNLSVNARNKMRNEWKFIAKKPHEGRTAMTTDSVVVPLPIRTSTTRGSHPR